MDRNSAPRGWIRLIALPVSGGDPNDLDQVFSAQDRISRDGVKDVFIPVGEQEVWVFTHPHEEGEDRGYGWGGPQDNLFGKGRVVARQGENVQLQVNLGPGAIIRGQVFDAKGKPVVEQTGVFFGVRPIISLTDPHVFWADTDSSGRFYINGLPPETRLYSRGGGVYKPIVVDTGPPGSTVEVRIEEIEKKD